MTKPEPAPRNFGVFLSQIEEGGLQADLSAELQRCNVELSKHAESSSRKAKGSITIVLELEHEVNGTVDVRAEIKTRLPKSKRSRSVFWTNAEGNLINENPRQKSLNFKSIAADSPAKDLGGPAAIAAKDVANG